MRRKKKSINSRAMQTVAEALRWAGERDSITDESDVCARPRANQRDRGLVVQAALGAHHGQCLRREWAHWSAQEDRAACRAVRCRRSRARLCSYRSSNPYLCQIQVSLSSSSLFSNVLCSNYFQPKFKKIEK